MYYVYEPSASPAVLIHLTRFLSWAGQAEQGWVGLFIFRPSLTLLLDPRVRGPRPTTHDPPAAHKRPRLHVMWSFSRRPTWR